MARPAVVWSRDMIGRFARGEAAVMTGGTVAADNTVIHPGRYPCPGTMTGFAGIRHGDMVQGFPVNQCTVMAEKTGSADDAVIHLRRRPAHWRVA